MIEDNNLQLKIAENPIESKWESIKKRATEGIEASKIEIEINAAIVELAEKKINTLKLA